MNLAQLKIWQETLRAREIEDQVGQYLFRPFIILILGSRQVGKTSLLRRSAANLIFKKKVDPQQILYFDFEIVADVSAFAPVTPENIQRIILSYGADDKKRVFLFLDEIQYHQDPANLLKVIFDHLPNVSLIVSGSSTLKIKQKFSDSLAGRHKTFLLHPLSFGEFLDFRGEAELLRSRLRPHLPPRIKESLGSSLEDYFLYGGYPKVALAKSKEEKISVLESIFTSYVRRDIKDLGNIEEPEKFNKLVSLLAFQAGNLINFTELGNSSTLNRQTLERYLFLLENTFIINLVKPYFTNRRKELVKSPKVYFQDTGLRNYIINNFAVLDKRVDSGALFENGVFALLWQSKKTGEELRYWRNLFGLEVDFIKIGQAQELLPYEVKWQKLTRASLSPGFSSFLRSYRPKKGFMITRDFSGRLTSGGTKVSLLPAYAL
jgi:predicted AAA+ superfamily ATPase